MHLTFHSYCTTSRHKLKMNTETAECPRTVVKCTKRFLQRHLLCFSISAYHNSAGRAQVHCYSRSKSSNISNQPNGKTIITFLKFIQSKTLNFPSFAAIHNLFLKSQSHVLISKSLRNHNVELCPKYFASL